MAKEGQIPVADTLDDHLACPISIGHSEIEKRYSSERTSINHPVDYIYIKEEKEKWKVIARLTFSLPIDEHQDWLKSTLR